MRANFFFVLSLAVLLLSFHGARVIQPRTFLE